MKYLERLVEPEQLIGYPSEYRRFNQVYEDASACLASLGPDQELYIVKYRDRNDELHFSFVPAVLIGADKPSSYGLKDLCAVLRK